MTEQQTDGYPPHPTNADLADLQRYGGIRFIAELLAADEKAMDAMLGVTMPGKTPAERWARAEQIHEQAKAERAEKERQAADLAQRIATDPELAKQEQAFTAAKEVCRVGHGAGCTYGGMSAEYGYWLAVEGCGENHSETCDLRLSCDGGNATTGFIGHEWAADDWLWKVAACQPCADAYAAKHPEWAKP